MKKAKIIAGSVFIVFTCALQKNNAPFVNIVSPKDSAVFSGNDMIPYKITVSDKEDGESKYDEIPATEIFMEIRYFHDLQKAVAFSQLPPKDAEGFALIRKQDCFTCHAVWSRQIGPSFNEMATRYSLKDTAVLAGHVINGSTGRWGPTAMPTHPALSQNDATRIVHWILYNGKDADKDYLRGAEGSISVGPQKNSSANVAAVLQASYADHGINGDSTTVLTGYHKTLILIK